MLVAVATILALVVEVVAAVVLTVAMSAIVPGPPVVTVQPGLPLRARERVVLGALPTAALAVILLLIQRTMVLAVAVAAAAALLDYRQVHGRPRQQELQHLDQQYRGVLERLVQEGQAEQVLLEPVMAVAGAPGLLVVMSNSL